VRHVRDGCRHHAALLRAKGASPFLDPFDARETSLRWLEPSAGETPEETLADLRRAPITERERLQSHPRRA
jgi:hypothetical protein